MGIRDFLAPTRGRILLFVIIFILVIVYDTAFAPFPGSPVVNNLGTQEGATSFVLYILLLPYILSCLLPAFAGLRKKRFFRLATLKEFMRPRMISHPQKAYKQQHFVFPEGTPVEESIVPQQPPEQSNPAKEKVSGKPVSKNAAKKLVKTRKRGAKKKQ